MSAPLAAMSAAAATPGGTAQHAIPESARRRLTPTERGVLALVAEGRKSREIADRLYISKRTVDFHLANIYHKLGVTNRVQAINEARRRGEIAEPVKAAATTPAATTPEETEQ